MQNSGKPEPGVGVKTNQSDEFPPVIILVPACFSESFGETAHFRKKNRKKGNQILIFSGANNTSDKSPDELKLGEKIHVPNPATIISRYPKL